MNNTQVLVLVALALVWLNSIRFVTDSSGNATFEGVAGFVLPVVVSAFFGLAAIGVVRRWRWMFALLMVCFLVGGLSAAVGVIGLISYQSNLELLLGDSDPVIAAYADSQIRAAIPSVVVGLIALAVGAVMFFVWKKRGAWGALPSGSGGG